MKSLSHLSHNQKKYRRMLHEEDETPPNEKPHAYYFNITYNGCDFGLLTPSAILALPKCLFKGWRLKFRGFICLRPVLVIAIEIDRHCTKMRTKKDGKHTKLLNLLCIVYMTHTTVMLPAV